LFFAFKFPTVLHDLQKRISLPHPNRFFLRRTILKLSVNMSVQTREIYANAYDWQGRPLVERNPRSIP